jgi:hypothetical protein
LLGKPPGADIIVLPGIRKGPLFEMAYLKNEIIARGKERGI